MPSSFQPMPLSRRSQPFNHPEWLFELKYDGFRALARIERGKATQLISRNGHPFGSFSDLAESMTGSLTTDTLVLDGEIVCLDRKGRPQFNDLLFRRGLEHASGQLRTRVEETKKFVLQQTYKVWLDTHVK